MTANEIGATPGTAIDFTNQTEIKIYKTPSVPGNKSENAYIGHNWTAQTVADISDSDISKYKFYKLDGSIYTPISATTPFPNTTTGTTTYYYSSINSQGCESDKSTLQVTVRSTTVTGGTISLSPSGTNTTTICTGGNVAIRNSTAGNAGALIGYTYTWEVSENNGTNWYSLADSPSSADYNYPVSVPIREGIDISNISKSLLVRRKTTSTLIDTNSVFPYSYSNTITVNVENNVLTFPNNIKSFSGRVGTTFTLPAIIASVPGTIIKYYDKNGIEISGTSVSLTQKGSYNFTVIATSPLGCTTSDTFQINAYDLTDCTTKVNRIYAKKAVPWSSGLSSTFFENDAVDNNNAGYATLTGGVVLLGIGTVGVDLYFVNPATNQLYTPSELAGKKITLKLGEQYSGLKVAGGLSVIARSTNITDPANVTLTNSSNVGTTVGVKGGVLDLLKGDNVFTFSFTPKRINGSNAEFNGVRVQLGSLIGVADLATAFYAYIEEEVTSTSGICTQETKTVTPYLYNIDNDTKTPLYPTTQTDIDGSTVNVVNQNIVLNSFAEDATWGNRTEVLNVASALSSVVHPYFAIDNDYNSFALFNSTVGVLNQQFLQVLLKQKAQPGDQVRIVLSYPNINLINLSLLQLGNFKLVYYLGDTVVGEDPLEQFRVLDIGLFNFGNHKRAVLTKPITIPFDRIEIRQFQTVNVNIGDGLHIYDVRIQPQMLFEGQSDPKQVTNVCAAEPLGIQKPDICTEYELSLAKVTSWGNQLTDENGNPLYEADGTTPIYSILATQDIANSNLSFKYQATNTSGTFTDYYELSRMFKEDENNGIILLKIQSKRQGCNYGEPEYLRLRLSNCNDAMANPIIRVLSGK